MDRRQYTKLNNSIETVVKQRSSVNPYMVVTDAFDIMEEFTTQPEVYGFKDTEHDVLVHKLMMNLIDEMVVMRKMMDHDKKGVTKKTREATKAYEKQKKNLELKRANDRYNELSKAYDNVLSMMQDYRRKYELAEKYCETHMNPEDFEKYIRFVKD